MPLPTMKTDWVESDFYNFSDLNRVGNAIAYLSETLKRYGYICITQPKTNYTEYDEPNLRDQLNQYITDINTIKIAFYASTVPPNSIRFLTAEMANRIEELMIETDELIEGMVSVFVRCDTINSGQTIFYFKN